MYVETYQWLENNPAKSEGWDTVRNSIFVAHLVHARTLINFFFSKPKWDTDVVVTDYIQGINYEDNDKFLRGQACDIGGKLVHLTINLKPDLMSQKEWQISEIMEKLVPIIDTFLTTIPANKFAENKLTESQEILSKLTSKLNSKPSRFSSSPST